MGVQEGVKMGRLERMLGEWATGESVLGRKGGPACCLYSSVGIEGQVQKKRVAWGPGASGGSFMRAADEAWECGC